MKKPKRINSVSVGLAVIFAGILYVGYAFLPVFWPLWQVSGMMRTACARANRSPEDAAVMADLLKETRRTGLSLTEDNFIFERMPFSDEELGAMKASRRDRARRRGRACVFRFRYAQTYQLPLVGVEYHLPYESQVRLDFQSQGSSMSNPVYELFYNSCTCTSVGPRR